MDVQDVQFIGSFPKWDLCPQDHRPAYAFIGRSNVGKSSLINMILGRKDLARVSKKPGKTQHINYYLVNNQWYLVDLPGYGYASTSQKNREAWRRMIHSYLERQVHLQYAFVLLDSNIPAQKIDMEFINYLGSKTIPFVLAYTKTDRMSQLICSQNIKAIQKELLQTWQALPPQFITSSEKNRGRDEILRFLEEANTSYFNHQKQSKG